ncbi:addiction module toxin component YafQ [Leptospira alexanderi serovar Manhao 3 str. L 60]|uniref:Addiction module toxin component YafQ n=2 Tax=Leptospira alexanderi TaxID=100053 RepID=V6I3H8_9LEPT|nr:addiction module toxin component YafQ [Leptospira alexanderi serovar Manhao 3 str. L 60]
MSQLIDGIPLSPKYKDHKLTGNYKNRRECHIEPNWLLIYKLDGDSIIFERTGTHPDLFD